ncbi:hypothetical protein Hdeb2414_s0007g00247741 [Helianthus debilis subsp. tardiflorus]
MHVSLITLMGTQAHLLHTNLLGSPLHHHTPPRTTTIRHRTLLPHISATAPKREKDAK